MECYLSKCEKRKSNLIVTLYISIYVHCSFSTRPFYFLIVNQVKFHSVATDGPFPSKKGQYIGHTQKTVQFCSFTPELSDFLRVDARINCSLIVQHFVISGMQKKGVVCCLAFGTFQLYSIHRAFTQKSVQFCSLSWTL